MNNLLIVYPHWPPSNLAGVHRARLVANHAHEFGWKVTVLTVHQDHYEEEPDLDLELLVSPHIRVVKVHAIPVLRVFGMRFIGDLGLRSWFSLRNGMRHLLKSEPFNFVWIPIPSWYISLLGRRVAKPFRVPFGVDYIDPWMYPAAPNESPGGRAWWTRKLAAVLEPYAIRHAALISGVAEGYYRPALERTFGPHKKWPAHAAMPYGFDRDDHNREPTNYAPPWKNESHSYFLYAGAVLPMSDAFLKTLFRALARTVVEGEWPKDHRIRFVGTGIRSGPSVAELARECGVAEIVQEYPERQPFLAIQKMLREASAAMIIGSSEQHYTASKTFQCLLSNRPVFAILHGESTAVEFLEKAAADSFLIRWRPNQEETAFESDMYAKLLSLIHTGDRNWNPTLQFLEPYSARQSAARLFAAIESITK